MALTVRGCRARKKRDQSQLIRYSGGEWDGNFAVFSLPELGEVDTALTPSGEAFSAQQAIDNDEMPLSQWFRRVADWPDRCERVRILLRAIAFELSICIEPSKEKSFGRSISTFCAVCYKSASRSGFAASCRLNAITAATTDIICERWLFSDWLLDRLTAMCSSSKMFNRYPTT